jgi:hypothetical protein
MLLLTPGSMEKSLSKEELEHIPHDKVRGLTVGYLAEDWIRRKGLQILGRK